MSAEEYIKNKNANFIKDWEKKRDQRLVYAFKRGLSFAAPFSLIMVLWEVGFTQDFIYQLPLRFFIFLILCTLYNYFIDFRYLEKTYQKLKKEATK